MSKNELGRGGAAVVAVLVIFIVVVLAAVVLFRGQLFNRGGSGTNVNITVPGNK